MANHGRPGWSRLRAIAAVVVMACTVSEPTPQPEVGAVASVEIVSGSSQTGTVGTELATPLVVRVLDADGKPLAGQVVNFKVTAGGGSVFGGAELTSASGVAQDRWTLGVVAGVPQAVEVRAVDNTTGAPLTFATFNAIAKAGAADSIVVRSGDLQTTRAGSAAPESLAVRVTDHYGNAVSGATVAWSTTTGAGATSASTTTTSTTGIAAVQWTAGQASGAAQVSATTGQLAPCRFTISVSSTTAVRVYIDSGGPPVTAQVRSIIPLVARVVDQYGNGVGGYQLEVRRDVRSPPVALPTDAAGRTHIAWLLDSAAGPQWIALLLGVEDTHPPSDTVRLLATPGPAAHLNVGEGNRQADTASATLYRPLSVIVTDAWGNAVAGAPVDFTVVAGGGTITPARATSGASGEARAVRWVLGPGTDVFDTLLATTPGPAPLPLLAFTSARAYTGKDLFVPSPVAGAVVGDTVNIEEFGETFYTAAHALSDSVVLQPEGSSGLAGKLVLHDAPNGPVVIQLAIRNLIGFTQNVFITVSHASSSPVIRKSHGALLRHPYDFLEF